MAAGLDLRAAEARTPKLKKAVKYAMIGTGKTIKEKFELVKRLGFQGVEVGYDGWATAEVGAGGEAHLKDVAEPMNKVLELG